MNDIGNGKSKLSVAVAVPILQKNKGKAVYGNK